MTVEMTTQPTAVTSLEGDPPPVGLPDPPLSTLPPPPAPPARKQSPLTRLKDLGSRAQGPDGPKRPTRPDGEESGSFDLRNTWQVAVGSILIPLGFVIIIIAWYGSAHARVVQQQIPYLVSGSFIGLGCVVLGGFLFFGHWLYRIYDQADIHHEERQRILEQIARSISTPGAVGQSSMNSGSHKSVMADLPGAPVSYFATATGTVYHQAGCAVIAHHPQDLRVLAADGLEGLGPCQICSPG